MASEYLEIERKFLVRSSWPAPVRSRLIRQIYLNPGSAISTRLRECEGAYTLTLKASINTTTRREYDVPVDAAMGADMMRVFTGPGMIEKMRHDVIVAGALWEVDVFSGHNSGLIVAEIELPSVDTPIILPDWAGSEVTHDGRFTNHALSIHPFARWGVDYHEL
jgi:adenylate cyclase